MEWSGVEWSGMGWNAFLNIMFVACRGVSCQGTACWCVSRVGACQAPERVGLCLPCRVEKLRVGVSCRVRHISVLYGDLVVISQDQENIGTPVKKTFP